MFDNDFNVIILETILNSSSYELYKIGLLYIQILDQYIDLVKIMNHVNKTDNIIYVNNLVVKRSLVKKHILRYRIKKYTEYLLMFVYIILSCILVYLYL